MINVLFICHGNICRSTMAQSVMAHLLKEQGMDDVLVDSAGTSSEEEGNGVHPGTQRKLRAVAIPCIPHRARQITRSDMKNFDMFVCMEAVNVRNLKRMMPPELHHKISLLLEYTGSSDDIDDPWYTGDFNATFNDIMAGCQALLAHLQKLR